MALMMMINDTTAIYVKCFTIRLDGRSFPGYFCLLDCFLDFFWRGKVCSIEFFSVNDGGDFVDDSFVSILIVTFKDVDMTFLFEDVCKINELLVVDEDHSS